MGSRGALSSPPELVWGGQGSPESGVSARLTKLGQGAYLQRQGRWPSFLKDETFKAGFKVPWLQRQFPGQNCTPNRWHFVPFHPRWPVIRREAACTWGLSCEQRPQKQETRTLLCYDTPNTPNKGASPTSTSPTGASRVADLVSLSLRGGSSLSLFPGSGNRAPSFRSSTFLPARNILEKTNKQQQQRKWAVRLCH